MELAEASKLEGQAREKHLFFTRRYLEAISPANFAATNPEALKLAAATGGENLARGLRNLFADVGKGRIALADESAFELGKNLATTPGAVVFENDVMQLLQYAPLTKKVYERPLLIVPPCISKYYMLDLKPDNSFVRYCVGEGHTVFLVSWRNPPPELGRLTWEDYVTQGVLKAVDVTLDVAGGATLNALGFCVGGALLAAAAAVMRARGDERLASVTLLATLLDYRDSGDLGTLIDEQYVAAREAGLPPGGVVSGSEIGMSFASLRANEFIWTAVVNNYLKGETAPPIDLLYWTNDQPNLPGAWFLYYIRNMYLENNLCPSGLPGGRRHADRPGEDRHARLRARRSRRPHRAVEVHVCEPRGSSAGRSSTWSARRATSRDRESAGRQQAQLLGRRRPRRRRGPLARFRRVAARGAGGRTGARGSRREAARRSPRARSSGTRVTGRSSPLRAGTCVRARRALRPARREEEPAMKHKLVTAGQALALVRDGDTVAFSGFVGTGTPEALIGALEVAVRAVGHPEGPHVRVRRRAGRRQGPRPEPARARRASSGARSVGTGRSCRSSQRSPSTGASRRTTSRSA